MAFKLPKSKCERKVEPKASFDPRSFRWVHKGRGYVLVGCPVGQWAPRNKRCKVGLRAHAVVTAAKRGRCKRGSVRAR
jgi:hypothetical protein